MALITQTQFAIKRLTNPYQLQFSLPALVIPCYADGSPKEALPSLTVELWQGTTKLAHTAASWTLTPSSCTATLSNAGMLQLMTLTDEKASIVVQAVHNGVTTKATLAISKSRAGVDSPVPALVRLESSFPSVSRSVLGVATPNSVSAWRTLQVGNDIEVLDKFNLIASNNSIPAGYWFENGWLGRPPVYNSTEQSLVFSANNGWHTTYCNLDKIYPKLMINFEYKNRQNCTDIYCSIAKSSGYDTVPNCNFYPTDQWQTFSKVMTWDSSQFGFFVRGVDSSGKLYDLYVRNLKVFAVDSLSYKGRNLAICEEVITVTTVPTLINHCAQLGELIPRMPSTQRFRLSFGWEYLKMSQSTVGETYFGIQSSIFTVVENQGGNVTKPATTPNATLVSGTCRYLMQFNAGQTYWNMTDSIRLDKRSEIAFRMDNCTIASGGHFKIKNLLLEEVLEGTTSDVWSSAPEATLIKRDGLSFTPNTYYTVPTNCNSIRFDLFRQSTLIDTKLIPVVADGQNGNWRKQVFCPKAELPNTPNNNTLAPNGWFNEMIPCTWVNDWWEESTNGWEMSDEGEYKSPPITHNELTKMRIRIVTEEDDILFAIKMRSSSESNFDFGLVGLLNNPNLSRTTNFTDRVSGINGYKVIAIHVPYAGEHYLELGYSKDGSVNTGQDCCWWAMDSGATMVWWMSQATVDGNTGFVISPWSTPVRWIAKDGEKGDKGNKGDKGESGTNGTPGLTGPAVVYRGDFVTSTTYYNNSLRRDIVKYSDTYYLFKGTNGTAAAWNVANWDSFGANFESVATKLLLAESAYIADWIINNGKITSQAKTEDGITPRAQLDGYNGEMLFNADKEVYTSNGNTKMVREQIAIRSSTGEVSVQTNEYDTAYISSQGIFANKAGMQALPSYTGIELKAAMVALGLGDLQKSAYSNNGAICGVYGSANNSNANPAAAWGGYFTKLFANGLYLRTHATPGNYWCNKNDNIIIVYNSTDVSVWMPANAEVGHLIFVRQVNAPTVWVRGNGSTIRRGANNGDVGLVQGGTAMMVWDGQLWHFGYIWA